MGQVALCLWHVQHAGGWYGYPTYATNPPRRTRTPRATYGGCGATAYVHAHAHVNTAARQPVDVRSADLATGVTEVSVAEIVRHDEDEVPRLDLRRRRREGIGDRRQRDERLQGRSGHGAQQRGARGGRGRARREGARAQDSASEQPKRDS